MISRNLKLLAAAFVVGIYFPPDAAVADIKAFMVEESSLSYDLSPSNYKNSSSNYSNSNSNYENSESNYANSPSNYKNSSSNFNNSSRGGQRVVMDDGQFIGYYVFSDNGVLNFLSLNGARIAYMPSGGGTVGLFASDSGEWCGAIGRDSSGMIAGFTKKCLFRFLMQ